MSLLLASNSGGSSQKEYVDDVFSTFLYQGNGSTQTINNGIDLTGKGGLVWIKVRSQTANHSLYDTARGATNALSSSQTHAQFADNTLTSFTSSGFAGTTAPSTYTYASWTFRRAPKFFDVVTVNHVNGVQSNIDLSQLAQIGFVTVKRLDQTSNWLTWHRSLSAGNLMYLNATNAQTVDSSLSVSGTTLSIAASVPSGQYVVYAWSHDPSEDGIIQCGSFSTTPATVNLGFEPQFVMFKDASSSGDWEIYDNMRGMTAGASSADDMMLAPNSSAAEVGRNRIQPNATGFTYNGGFTGPNIIYLAIRRPNKPPTSGTEVYNAIAYTGNATPRNITGVGFVPDLVIGKPRDAVNPHAFYDRLRGATKSLQSTNTVAEAIYSNAVTGFSMDGVSIGIDTVECSFNYNTKSILASFFRRAPQFFDEVCYAGTGIARTVPHNLQAVPELVIIKTRSATDNWIVGCDFSESQYRELLLNTTDGTALHSYNTSFTSQPTESVINLGTNSPVNGYGRTFVSYMFASLPGVSKVGNYTGNGTSQTIDCGFSAGCRFFLVKSTSTTGNWWVFDSARGILTAADPALALNSTAAEITTADAVDNDPFGIIVNQEATCSINANGVSYVYLAIS